MSIAYFDGEFLDKARIAISPMDFGFARGVTVFELARVYEGRPFRLEDHLDRFDQGAKAFGIQCPLPRREILSAIETLIAKNAYPHSAIKLYLTAGECGSPGPAGFANSREFTPHLMIVEDEVKPLHVDAPKGVEFCQRGISLKSVPFSRQLPLFKSTNYALGFQAAQEAAVEGWDEILFVHSDGYITEATISNFFVVIDGKLCTPARGMLFGITRKVLLELARETGLPVQERDITPSELDKATEAFITGSIAEMIPVRKVDHFTFPTTTEGPVFRHLRQAFSAYIKCCASSLAKSG